MGCDFFLSLEFQSEAAIINFYHSDSVLFGHKDDVEEAMAFPIVSLSLGCSAVFLIAESKEVILQILSLQKSSELRFCVGIVGKIAHTNTHSDSKW
jgi:alkylated DNA repair dioxygenase AlkB